MSVPMIYSFNRFDPELISIRVLAVSKTNCCFSTLAGISGYLLSSLQSVLNVACRLIYSTRKSEHITAMLRSLQWLRNCARLCGFISDYVFKRFNVSTARDYHLSIQSLVRVDTRRHLRVAHSLTVLMPQTGSSNLSDRTLPVAAARRGTTYRHQPQLSISCRRLAAIS